MRSKKSIPRNKIKCKTRKKSNKLIGGKEGRGFGFGDMLQCESIRVGDEELK